MMNLLKNLASKTFGDYNSTPESIFCCYTNNDPRWTSGDYESVCEEGFLRNVIAFRAINLISRGIASIPMSLRIVENQTRLAESSDSNSDSHSRNFRNLSNRFNRPNHQQSRGTFFEYIVNFLLISGNAFIHYSDSGEFTCLRTDRVQIVPNTTKTAVDHYVYCVDSSQYRIERQNLLHIKFFNPLNDWYGLSPLQVASRAIDQHNAMSNHNLSILQNGGRPSGCLLMKSSLMNLTNQQREQLRDDIRKAYGGAFNAGKIMVLEGDFEWHEMGLSPKDLDFSGGKDLTTREIAQAFGVPPVLVGLRGDSGFSNYREARMHLWEDTILPLAELIRLEFGNWISQKFGEEIEIILDLDSIHALTSRRDILWQKISAADFLTTDEKREILGFPPFDSSPKEQPGGEKGSRKENIK